MIKKLIPGAVFFRSITSLAFVVAGMSVLTPVYAESPLEAGRAHDSASSVKEASIKSAKVAASLLQDIVRVDGRLVAVGERGHIIWSDDSGKTWQQADVPTRQMLNAVYFPTPELGWAVGYDGLILNTTDGGKTWAIQLDGLKFVRERAVNQLPVMEAEKESLKAEMIMAKAALEKAEEEGKEDLALEEDAVSALDDKLDGLDDRIEDARRAMQTTVANPLMDVWFRDAKTGFVVGAFGEFLTTEDGGANWKSNNAILDNSEHNHLNAIAGLGDVLFIAGEAAHIYRSVDAGVSWTLLESPDPENGSFFSVNIMGTGDQIMISGLRGAIYRSGNQGDSWKQIAEPLHKNMNAVNFAGNDVVLAVGNDGAFLRSRDGGRTFSSHVQEDRLTLASVVQAADGNYVLVGAGGVKIIPPARL